MKYKKYYIFLLIVIFCIGSFFWVKTPIFRADDIFRISIYPSGTLEESYLFTLYSNRKLEVNFGKRRHEDIQRNNFIGNTVSRESLKLSEHAFSKIIEIANKVSEESKESNQKKFVLDGYIVKFFYKNKIYEIIYDFEPSTLGILIDEIIKLSPIPVKLHGWA